MVWPTLGSRTAKEQEQEQVPATGELAPRARRVAVLGMGAGGGRPLPLRGPGVSRPEIIFEIFDAKSRVWGQFNGARKLTDRGPT